MCEQNIRIKGESDSLIEVYGTTADESCYNMHFKRPAVAVFIILANVNFFNV